MLVGKGKCDLTTQFGGNVIHVGGTALNVLGEILSFTSFGENVQCPNRRCLLSLCTEGVDGVVEARDCGEDDDTRAW